MAVFVQCDEESVVEATGRPPGHLRRWLVLLLALVLQVPQYASPISVSAHCPGGTIQYRYATSQKLDLNTGIRGAIQWTNPSVCALDNGTGFTAEWVTTCDSACTVGRDGWVQAGWIKRTGYSSPKGYCEMAASEGGSGFGPSPPIFEFPLLAASYVYKGVQNDSIWECVVGGDLRASKTTSWMGFSFGDRLIVGGETISPHSQIGRMAPDRLKFSSLERRLEGTAWGTLNLSCCTAPGAPYGMDEPQAGELRNWTNAH